MPTNRILSVGINQYPSRPLQWAVADAKEMADSFSAIGYSAELLLDGSATRTNILEGIRKLSSAKEGIRILYMAGHAALATHGARFIPYGATEWTGAVSFSDISALLKAGLSTESPLIVLLDCCHAGALEVDVSFTTHELREAINKDVAHVNVASLLACTVGATAREVGALRHGAFTYYLLSGLSGNAADSDGGITAEALYNYASKQMERHSYQKPSLKASVSGRIVLARRLKPDVTRKLERDIAEDLSKLASLVAETDATIAKVKPPVASRDEYRRIGWQRAAKAIQRVAEKRTSIQHRWGEILSQYPAWKRAEEDVDGLLREVANISTGTVTEFGPVIERLGDGGFGSVFRVDSPEGPMAYKVYHASELGSTAKLERFRIGYRAMNLLSHPRIVRVHKFLESPLSFYMSYVDGQNLRKGFGLLTDEADLVRVLGSIVQTVEYAHGVGVIHRDIKPENVILSWDEKRSRWEPSLTDFDLAWFPAATSHTVEAFGAPFYAAPEQLSDPGKTAAHQPAVDVYAIGMLGLFLLSGKDPVSKDDALTAARITCRRWHSPQAADLLLDVLSRAVEKNPNERLSLPEARDVLIRIAELLSAAADPNSAIDPGDFLAHVGALVGYSAREPRAGLGSARPSRPVLEQPRETFLSSSARTEVDVVVVDGGFDVIFRKLDAFLAEKTTTFDARNALLRRLDNRLDSIRKTAPAGTGIDRRGGGSNVDVRVEFRNTLLTRSVAAFLARTIADIVAAYETF